MMILGFPLLEEEEDVNSLGEQITYRSNEQRGHQLQMDRVSSQTVFLFISFPMLSFS